MWECHGCDALSSIITLENFLLFDIHVVDDDIVANWVDNLSVVQQEDVVCNVSFQTWNKLGHKTDIWSAVLGAVSVSLCLFIGINLLIVEGLGGSSSRLLHF